MKLIVDLASIVGRFMHLEDPEFGNDITVDGKKWHIPSVETCLERVEVSFQRVLDQYNISPTDIIGVIEPESTGAARKRKYPAYKASREKRPKQFYDVSNELNLKVQEMVMAAGGICATSRVTPATEGDDLVDCLARLLPETMIWTSDRDLLSSPATHHLIWDELDPIKFPVPREYIQLYRAIVTGDTSDNLPGCRGFGEKAWEKMLALIGPEGIAELKLMVEEKRLHELQSEVKDFKPFQLLIDKAEDIYLTFELMTFAEVPAHKIRWSARVTDCSKTLVTADNFKAEFTKVKEALKAATHAVLDFESDTPIESDAWLAGTKDDSGKGGVGVDVMASEICGMGLKVGTDTWYFSVDHPDTNNITLDDLERVIELLKDKRVYGHNSTNFENILLYNHFGYFLEGMVDTLLMASYVDENAYSNGLKALSKNLLGYDQTSYDEVLAGRRGMRNVTGEEVLAYGIDDVITTDSLQNLFSAILQYEGTYDTFLEVEKDSAFVTSLAFVQGVGFDQEAFDELKKTNDANIERAEAELNDLLLKIGFASAEFVPLPELATKGTVCALYETVTGNKLETKVRTVKGLLPLIDDVRVLAAVQAGPEAMNTLYKEHWVPRVSLNVRSPKQVSRLLYDVLEAPVRIYNTATDKMREGGEYVGNPSTDDDAIANAIAYKDVSPEGIQTLEKLVEYKGYLTRESLFLSKYPKFVHWKTGKLHCNMRQSATTTRRFTHSAPNLGQQPKNKGKEVRNVVKAKKGYKLLTFDLNSQELKLQAEDSQCAAFVSCYSGEVKKDVHSMTGYQVALMQGIEVPEYPEFEKAATTDGNPLKPFRASGKATNFSTSYLCRAKKLSHMLCIDEITAQSFIDAKDKAFPGLMPHIRKYIEICRQRGYSETFMGGRRHLAKAFAMARNEGERAAVGRLAWSFRIQGSAADQIKMAMVRAWRSGVFQDGLCVPLFTVHDEFVVQIAEDHIQERGKIIHSCVCGQYANMKIQAESDPKIGTNFGSMKDLVLD